WGRIPTSRDRDCGAHPYRRGSGRKSIQVRSGTMEWSRREVLGSVVGSLGTVAATARRPGAASAQPKARQRPANEPFGYCLNTSTIRGNQLGIVDVVAAAAK